MANIKHPIASVRIFQPAQKDPKFITSGRPAAHYDILRDSWMYGTISRDANNRPLLEFLEDREGNCAGLVNRATVTGQDARLSQYSTSGGTWDEFIRPTEPPRKYWLVQTDSTANQVWTATSTYAAPSNLHCAIRLILPDAPPDHDATTYPPRVQLELGNGEWAVRTSAQDGTQLMRKLAGVLVPVLDIPEPSSVAKSDGIERIIWLRFHRGRLWISTDWGRSYVSYGNPDGTDVTIASSSIVLRGQGGMCLFRLDSLVYATGTYESPTRGLIEPRVGACTLTGKYTAPTGTTLTLTDLGAPASSISQYRATLTPTSSGTTPFAAYTCPELYAVETVYASSTTGALGLFTTPFDAKLSTIRIDRPLELAGGTASFTARVEPYSILTNISGWDRCGVQIRLGWTYSDGSVRWWSVFTGYIRNIRTTQSGYGSELIQFDCDNLAAWLNEDRWTPDYVRPLGGRTVNAASDIILGTIALDSSYRSWSTLGDWTPSEGRAENPFALTSTGKSKWESLTELQGLRGLEVGVLQNGTLATVPFGWTSGVTHVYRLEEPNSLEQMAQQAGLDIDFQQRATAAYCTGEGPLQDTISAAIIDTVAEGNPANARFKGRRVPIIEELSGQVSPGILALRAQALAESGFPIRYDVQLGGFLNLDVARRDQVVVYDAESHGIPDGTAHVVLTQSISWDLGIYSGDWKASQVLGLRAL